MMVGVVEVMVMVVVVVVMGDDLVEMPLQTMMLLMMPATTIALT